ncbi:DUF1059 domain-containing protein [Halobacteriaceae archaeon GCM10025711]
MAKEFTCTADGCNFSVRANEEDEVVEHVQEHAQKQHGMDLARQDIVDGIRTV